MNTKLAFSRNCLISAMLLALVIFSGYHSVRKQNKALFLPKKLSATHHYALPASTTEVRVQRLLLELLGKSPDLTQPTEVLCLIDRNVSTTKLAFCSVPSAGVIPATGTLLLYKARSTSDVQAAKHYLPLIG